MAKWLDKQTNGWKDGWTDRWKDRQKDEQTLIVKQTVISTNGPTDEQTENLSILQDFVSYWGYCLATASKIPHIVGQGHRWPYDASWQLVIEVFSLRGPNFHFFFKCSDYVCKNYDHVKCYFFNVSTIHNQKNLIKLAFLVKNSNLRRFYKWFKAQTSRIWIWS